MRDLIHRFPRFALLLALLIARVDGDDPERDPNPPEPAGDDPGPDPDSDGDPDTDSDDSDAGNESEGDEAPPAALSPAEVGELRERTRRLEAEIELARTRGPSAPTPEQQEWEREQRILDNAATSAQDRHAIEVNRALRQSHALSQQANQRAEDLADRAEYNLKAMDNPTYRKYAARVEAERQRIASNGRGTPSREIVLAVLLGQDMLKGKVTPTKSGQKVARQAPARARSDVGNNTGRSERDKRRARLENQII